MAAPPVTTIRSIRQRVATLSGGQRQSVAVARAVMWNSRVVILDEPTAALGVAQTAQVLDLVKRLREQGLAVVIISHNLIDVFEVADRITVLRLGRNAGVFERERDDAGADRARDHLRRAERQDRRRRDDARPGRRQAGRRPPEAPAARRMRRLGERSASGDIGAAPMLVAHRR